MRIIQSLVPSYQDSKALCDKTNVMWQKCFKKHFDSLFVGVVSKEHDLVYQKTKHGDFIVELDLTQNEGRYLTIETKIRNQKYYERFLKDGKILFEIMGNVESNKSGSSFFDCEADLYAYGFYVEGQNNIYSPQIFHIKPLQEFLNNNRRNYQLIKSNTEGLYSTSFILVPLRDIPIDCISHTLEPKIKLDVLFWSQSQ